MPAHSTLLPLTAFDTKPSRRETAVSLWRRPFSIHPSGSSLRSGTRTQNERQTSDQRSHPQLADNVARDYSQNGSDVADYTQDLPRAEMTPPAAVAGSPWMRPLRRPTTLSQSMSISTDNTERSDSSASTALSRTPLISQTNAVSDKGALKPSQAQIDPPSPLSPAVDITRVATTVGLSPSWGWAWFRSEYFSLMMVFAPFAIAGGAHGWPGQIVFALSVLSLAGLEVFISTTLERICLAYADRNILASVVLEIIPTIFPTMIGVVALIYDETSVAKSFVIGNVLNNILLGTGAALFVGGVKPGAEGYAQLVSETALELIKLTMISSAPIVMAWSMIFVMTSQTELTVDPAQSGAVNGSSSSVTGPVSPSTTNAIEGLSRGTAIILLVVYLLWMLFRRVTHRGLFLADDRGRQAAAAAARVGRRRSGGELKMKEKEDASPSPPAEVFPCLSTPATLVLIPAVLVAALVAAAFSCYYLVTNISAIVPSSTSEDSPTNTLQRHFIASIILPLVVNLYNYVRASELACCGGRDVSLAVHLTYGAGAASILLTLPILVLVGWAIGQPLLLDFAAFDVAILAGAVWATSILMTTHVDYFRGFVFLCLYIILALAIFLFKE